MASNTVTLRFVGDTKDLDRAFTVVEGGVDKAEGKFASFANKVKPLAAAAGGALALHFGKASVDAFKESEEAQNRLEQAFKKFPRLAGDNIGSLRQLNTELAKKTKFDDDATASAQATLAQFGLTGAQIKQLTPLVQDYAAKTGKDLGAAATTVGKALQGKAKALGVVGLQLKDTGDLTKNFEQVVGGLRDKVGGFAQAEGKTAAGQAAILKNQFGELQETVGSMLVPALQKLAEVGLTVIGFFQGLPGPVKTALAIGVAFIGVVFAISKAMQAWTAIQAAFNVVMSANPVVLVALAVAALVAGVIIAYQKVGWFHDLVNAAWNTLKGFASFLSGAAVAAFNGLKSAAEAVGRVLAGMWDGYKQAAVAVFGAIARLWNSSIGKLSFKVPSWVPGIGGKGFEVPDMPVPKLARGGIVDRPTLALIGEAGPEAVVPLRGGGGTGGNTFIINVTAAGRAEGQAAGQAIVDALTQWQRQNGTLPLVARTA